MLLNPDFLRETLNKMKTHMEEGDIKKAVSAGRLLSPGKKAPLIVDAGIDIAAMCLKEMDRKEAGRVAACMPHDFVINMLENMEEADRLRLLNNIPPDNIDGILEHMTDQEREDVVPKLDKKLRDYMKKVEKYPKGSVGRLASPYFLSVEEGRTVAETLDSILAAPLEIDRRPYVYVIGKDKRPLGVVSIKDLLRVGKNQTVEKVMNVNVATVKADDTALEAARMIQNRRVMILPVVGEDGTIEGVLTFDDAMRILSDDVLDLMTFSAGTQEESFYTPPMKAVKGRLPWMVANVFLNMGAVIVITRFEMTIATVAILAAFIPMITDMGGNVGIQSLSVAIRSIALGEARLSDIRGLIRKESAVGIVNGLVLGALFGAVAFALKGNPYLGLLAGMALGVNVLIAGIVGGTLPFLIKSFGKDPAMMTGPFLTTITDITGVSVYLGLSTAFMALISG